MSTSPLNQEQTVRARKFVGVCLQPDDAAAIPRTFNTWSKMLERCFIPGGFSSESYLDRGISVCEEWFTFAGFVADMGLRPADMTLDRIDNNGNYEPSNCRWATKSEQARNTRRNRMVGDVLQVDAALLSGVCQSTISRRMAAGYSSDEAINTPSIIKVKLNQVMARAIKDRLMLGHPFSQIAKEFDVSRQMVSAISSGKYWRSA
ncbi:MAG: hypothetical protein C0411_01060 [Pseudomonas sp.]|nr:hypothetical protein [Pseudomonas sp.]